MNKQDIRERVWDELEESGQARFPFPPHGRIPNFAGAKAAANRLAELDAWRSADSIKANPDAPQLPVRRRALHEGKTVYMAVPRLRDEECFVELDPERIDDLDAAPTVSSMDEYGRQVGPEAVESVDVVVSGSVAVREDGARIGKGEGYSDLEYAVLRELDLVDDETPVVTTVHEMQLSDADWAVDDHDVPLDYLVTPERTIETETPFDRPTGVDWDELDEERIEEMPVLASRRERSERRETVNGERSEP
ncbi:5-formyltetrahydrofolate cyclo-ligase [Halomicrobium zhouii]|uniref:5-formyltetrahydrofolate cyclo-ligase n=1 Tax=Halomicrobium zhouii TaxID=767519 RepID=A0A1I6L913_9EURY|nr:5-formyltetrahydrofolate cyclo-ligase [Halomicrobium zhouii]SFR99884.1 5-formyltetrahydrofolate cyclo-ligase [Halomicrobium zhouii]